MNNLFENKKIMQGLVLLGVLSLSIFFLVSAKNASNKGDTPAVITVEGTGEFFAIPDTSSFTFSVEKDGATQKEAKDNGASIMNTIIDSLKKEYNIEDRDIKTTNLSVSPKYEYAPACYGYGCNPSSPKIIGYTYNQSISLKIRDIDNTGDVASKLAEWGATNVYGPEFTLADEDEAREKARQDAIVDAKVKATKLSKQLGVRLGKIQSFSESNGGYSPMYGRGGDMANMAVMEKSVSPEVPVGENKYTSTVYVTYEIR